MLFKILHNAKKADIFITHSVIIDELHNVESMLDKFTVDLVLLQIIILDSVNTFDSRRESIVNFIFRLFLNVKIYVV